MSLSKQILHQLSDLETMLRSHQLWESDAPSQSQLASTQPFAIDSLTPTQWLQWIFIPKMRQAAQGEQLPTQLEIAPYFEQALTDEAYKVDLLIQVRRIDAIYRRL
ncbi:MAG: YqcC family protein [Vibrio sp.]